MTDLAHFIAEAPLADTHEHLKTEAEFLADGPDVLEDLFDHYTRADLAVAGASPEALKRLIDLSDPDLAGRFLGIRDAWEAVKHTGYGEGVRLTAKRVYGLEEIVPEALPAAQKIAEEQRKLGNLKYLLKDVANLSYVQIDDFRWECEGDDFFQYDINVLGFACGEIDAKKIHQATGVEVQDLLTLRAAIDVLFAKWGPRAVAVKTQHAYSRTLAWTEREGDDVRRILGKTIFNEPRTDEEKLVLGDWALARCVEAAIKHDLPVKIHTGYYAGNGYMPIERIPAGLLAGLIRRYPKARFVLMHTAYPYTGEILALAKHFPNVYLDLCWAWSIDPRSTQEFVRRAIHAVPSNKLLVFGGDSFYPNAAVSYSFQARAWLTRALQAEVDERFLTEKDAIQLAARWMGENQKALFHLP